MADSLAETETPRWTGHHESLLVSWAERASGYRWLHYESARYYSSRSNYIALPSSILAYISGGTVLTSEIGAHDYLRYLIGFLALAGGVLTNVQGLLRYKENAEQHRIIGNSYASYYRNIAAELSMDRDNRESPIEYIQSKRQELDRLSESSPTIPEAIVKKFNQNFKHVKIHKPDITNGLHSVSPNTGLMDRGVNTADVSGVLAGADSGTPAGIAGEIDLPSRVSPNSPPSSARKKPAGRFGLNLRRAAAPTSPPIRTSRSEFAPDTNRPTIGVISATERATIPEEV